MDLTKEEKSIILALERIAKKWPKNLILFSDTGSITIRRFTESGEYKKENEIAVISGIKTDGGDSD